MIPTLFGQTPDFAPGWIGSRFPSPFGSNKKSARDGADKRPEKGTRIPPLPLLTPRRSVQPGGKAGLLTHASSGRVPSRIGSRRYGADLSDAVDMTRSSAFTVAGTVPDFHRIPFSAFTRHLPAETQ